MPNSQTRQKLKSSCSKVPQSVMPNFQKKANNLLSGRSCQLTAPCWADNSYLWKIVWYLIHITKTSYWIFHSITTLVICCAAIIMLSLLLCYHCVTLGSIDFTSVGPVGTGVGPLQNQDVCSQSAPSLSDSLSTSSTSCVSFTRLNEVLIHPTKEDLNKLMKDYIFLDYFNVYLNLPVSYSNNIVDVFILMSV